MKIDLKTILIVVLSLLVIALYIGVQKGYIGENHKAENDLLTTQNDSLQKANNTLQMQIGGLEELTNDLNIKLDSAQAIITKLKGKRNEIPSKVNRMSANDVTDAFTKYLDKKDKSRNTGK